MKRRVAWILVLLLAAGLGVWLYRNASLDRLQREFVPWMQRLERWRDAIEDAQRALKSRDATPADPAGIGDLRSWAWRDLSRIASVSYSVDKPAHDLSNDREKTSGRVVFTVGGFREDGARVERSAQVVVVFEADSATVLPSPQPSPGGRGNRIRLESLGAISERAEEHPRFRDGTAEAGLGTQRNDPPLKLTNWLISDIWPGSGVAVLDYNRDGAEDLFVGDGVRSILYENDGLGHFTEVTAKAGLEGVAATGVAAGDVNSDGYADLFVTNAFGPARLFRNRGNGTFADVTEQSGTRVPSNARSAVFADFDADGDLDLAVAVTGDYYSQLPDPPFDANDGRENFLYINDGKGHFTDATRAWGLSGVTRWTLSAIAADYDGDGRTDLLFTNDFGLKNLYRSDGGRRFGDVTKEAGAAVRAYGMSGAAADFDGDGLLDLYTTGTHTQWYFVHDYPSLPIPVAGRLFLPIAIRWMETMARGNTLLLQRPDHTFRDATDISGAQRAGWNWSVAAADFDNDGWPDIYATNGMWGDGRDKDRELEFWWET
ncbi:MAG: FG-GAP repeat domain-containing protein, partial [Thermoanaerobaculia bacterium]